MATTAKQIFNDLNLVVRLNQHIEDIANSDDAAATALLAKQTSFKVLAELDAIRNPDPREEAQFEHQRAANAHTDAALQDASERTSSELVASQLPFHLQGDDDFNRASAMAARRALQRSEPIKSKVRFLWDVARGQRNAEVSRTASLDRALGRSAASDPNAIEEREYATMMLLIFKVLRDDFVLEMAQLQVHCDWEVDSRHSDALSFEQFFAAIFELVDLWTCDIAESTYVRFLELLVRRITLRVVIFLDDMKLKLALSDNFDDAVVVKAIPLSTIERFATIAKVVEASGVRTVGELASADPFIVERERLAYLDRHNTSKEKIGAKLEHLLATFNNLSDHLLGGFYGRNGSGASGSGASGSSGVYRGRGSGGRGGNSGGGVRDGYRGGGGGVQYSLENMKLVRRRRSGDSGADPHDDALLTDATTAGAGGAKRARINAITRRLSIHDLSQTESEIINSVRSAFLLEKGISIGRKRADDMDAVRAELEKFDVDPRGLSDAEALDKYNVMFEMFVLRDGESIKALAKTMLTQIKLELQAHGVIVDDDSDAEALYDGFYGAVVATNGDAIVKDAQTWVTATVDSKAVASYLKADYHELKDVTDVALIGSQPGDDEFVSLLSNDDDDGDNEPQRIANSVAADAAVKPSSSSASSQRKQSQMRLQKHAPPPIQTNVRIDTSHSNDRRVSKPERSPAAVTAAAARLRTPSSVSSSPRRPSRPRTDSSASAASPAAAASKRKPSKENSSSSKHAPSQPRAGERQRQASDANSHTLEAATAVADNAIATEQATDASEHVSKTNASELSDCLDVQAPALQADTTGIQSRNDSGYNDATDGSKSQQRTSMSLKASLSALNLAALLLTDLEARDIVNDDVDREAQGVAFVYEEDAALVEVAAPVVQAIVAELVPKVPKILLGPSGAAGANIAVAARYIQLLGLGTVLTASDEAELYALLQSDEGRDVDLVCLDVGDALDTAGEKLTALQVVAGKRVIVLGGDVHDAARTQATADDCVARGAIYFATLPIHFPVLRTEILAYFENATQPYILRPRKATAAFGGGNSGAAALRLATRSIGAVGILSGHDVARKVSTAPLAFAMSAKASQPPQASPLSSSSRTSSSRKPTTPMLPPSSSSLLTPAPPPQATSTALLPTITKDKDKDVTTRLVHFKALDDLRVSETTAAALVPSSPRSLKSSKKTASPRFATAFHSMIR